MTTTTRPLLSRASVARVRPGDVLLDLLSDEAVRAVAVRPAGFVLVQGEAGGTWWRHISYVEVVVPVERQR